jgi:hypothetical protein
MDSIASLKVKITEGEGIDAGSLSRSTFGVEQRAGVPKCELGKLTSNSITHANLHKPNHKLISA